jgi:iron complex transport system substrate-binding protein
MPQNTLLLALLLFCLAAGFAPPSWAMRIVSLLPSNTEIVEALGGGDDVVGVTVFEKNRGSRAVVGDFIHPSMEKIVSLHADLILGGAWRSSRAITRLRAMGYRVVEVKNPSSIEDIYESIHIIAGAAGRSDHEALVIQALKARLEALRARAARLPHRVRMFLEVDLGPWTPGGPDFLTEICAAAGADNIFSDLPEQAAHVSSESVVARNPELIISLNAKRAEIARRAGWKATAAVQRGWIIDDISADLFSRPSPRLWDAAEQLEDRLEALEHHG